MRLAAVPSSRSVGNTRLARSCAQFSGLYSRDVRTPSEIDGYVKDGLFKDIVKTANESVFVASVMPVCASSLDLCAR